MVSEQLVLGVDVGGTKVAVAALDGLDVVARVERPTVLTSSSALLDGLEKTAREVIAQSAEPMAVGVGVPSQIEYDTGRVETSVNIPLTGVPLREELGRRFGVPVFVDNDANCAALAEAHIVGCDELLMLTLGTGVGGGVVTGGRIFRGANGLGAELGHFTVKPDGPPCPGNCPNSGCLEAYCSGQALERDATELARDKPGSRLAAALDKDGRSTGASSSRPPRRANRRRPAARPLRPHAGGGDRGLRERLPARARRDRRRPLARLPSLPRQGGPGGGARALPALYRRVQYRSLRAARTQA